MKEMIVGDLMVSISEYATVSEGATMLEAVLALEKAQDEFKKELDRLLRYSLTEPGEHIEAYVNYAINNINHNPKRLLKGINSCWAFFGSEKRKYLKKERRDIYDWIIEQTASILNHAENQYSINKATAYRVACVTWLRNNSLITVSKKDKVLPLFIQKISHK